MSGLEQRTKDRDGAPVDGRGVAPRAAGVPRPATGLAEIAQIAQTSKTSMKWASAPCRDVPLLIAQIAEISLGSAGQPFNMWWINAGLLENAITVITEKRLESVTSRNALRVSPSADRKTVRPNGGQFHPWWIVLHENTNDPMECTLGVRQQNPGQMVDH